MEEFTNDMLAGLELGFEERLVNGVYGIDDLINSEHVLFMRGFETFRAFVHNIYL